MFHPRPGLANAAAWTANVITGLVLVGAVMLSRLARRRATGFMWAYGPVSARAESVLTG